MSGLTELKIKHQEYFLGADYRKIKKSPNLNKFVKSFIK
jgi:hypothetical protein